MFLLRFPQEFFYEFLPDTYEGFLPSRNTVIISKISAKLPSKISSTVYHGFSAGAHPVFPGIHPRFDYGNSSGVHPVIYSRNYHEFIRDISQRFLKTVRFISDCSPVFVLKDSSRSCHLVSRNLSWTFSQDFFRGFNQTDVINISQTVLPSISFRSFSRLFVVVSFKIYCCDQLSHFSGKTPSVLHEKIVL